MVRFDDITEQIRMYYPDADLEAIRKAHVFAATNHRGQKRLSGEPYLHHPLEVAHTLAQMKLDLKSITAGLLHDILEDTDATLDEVRENFGPEVAAIVDGVTKIGQLQVGSKEREQAENFRKMMLATTNDIRVILVKLADRLHNVRTIQFLTEAKQRRLAGETLNIYAPLADRLGIGRIHRELREHCFRVLQPDEHRSIVDRIEARRVPDERFIEVIRDRLEVLAAANNIPSEISGRIKSAESIFTKMREQGIDVERVYDYFAFRIITETKEQCYTILGFAHSTWKPIPDGFDDYIANPKPNGYQSLHTNLLTETGQPFELQIRTKAMHRFAEDGVAAHWRYKGGAYAPSVDPEFDVLRRSLRQVIEEWHQTLDDPQDFLDSVKMDLYTDEVFVFTPKGDVHALPRGAGPLDFAYRVHTDLGHRCTGAKVNGRLVPLETPLRNRDTVEIVVSRTPHPKREWLDFVVTSRARDAIRRWLRTNDREVSVDIGKGMLSRRIRRHHLNQKRDLIKNPRLPELLQHHGLSDLDDLFAELGYGKLSAREVIEFLVPVLRAETAGTGHVREAVTPKRSFKSLADRVIVNGEQGMMVKLARCCHPVPGNAILGYVTRGRGITVHSKGCHNLDNVLHEPDRVIGVEWSDRGRTPFPVPLSIQTEDRKGILAAISAAVAEHEANIQHAQAETLAEEAGLIELVIEVRNDTHLRAVLNAIRAVGGVRKIVRL